VSDLFNVDVSNFPAISWPEQTISMTVLEVLPLVVDSVVLAWSLWCCSLQTLIVTSVVSLDQILHPIISIHNKH
jgi:hypothetical protein